MAVPPDDLMLREAVEAGEAPLEVYADWLEEVGHEDAAGVRWLASRRKRPRRDGAGWVWHHVFSPFVVGSGSILPLDVRNRLQSRYADFGEALHAAAASVTFAGRSDGAV